MAEYSTLLSTKEQTVCKNLSSQRTLDGKRAKALLAMNDGDVQTIAAKKSGLSYGQVKYLLTAFRKKRLSVFSEATATAAKSQPVEKSEVKKSKTKKSKKVPKGSGKKKKKKEKKKKLKGKAKKQKEKKSKKKKSKKSKKK
jgi:hypothetical protein